MIIKKYKINLIGLILIVINVSGCYSITQADVDETYTIDKVIKLPNHIYKVKTPIYVDITDQENKLLKKRINIKSPNITLIEAVNTVVPTLSILADKGVDLQQKFDIKFNKSLGDYFDYLANITNYQFTLSKNATSVKIQSIVEKTWYLPVLSGEKTGVSTISETQTPEVQISKTKSTSNVSEWQQIVKNIKLILKDDAIIVDNQQLGVITAIGLPLKIKQVDKWLSNLIELSNKQIHLQVKVLDIIVDESVGQGINWELISQKSGLQIANNAPQIIDGAGIVSIGSVSGEVFNLGKQISLDIMLNLLQKQGRVRVYNQPNLTITNGKEAYISTGDEFSYVTSINAVPDANGNVVTTSEVARMNVGVDMRVVAKILPDNRIVVNIVPVISSLKSFTTLSSGYQELQTPNIALQKLSTQVIVESGKTIHLGGLIASKIADAAKGLPSSSILNLLFKSAQKTLERREIVILIKPTIIE